MGKESERDKEKEREGGTSREKLVCPALHQIVGKRQRQTSKNKQIWVKFYFRCRFAAVLGRQLAASRSHTCSSNETELLSSSRCGWRQQQSAPLPRTNSIYADEISLLALMCNHIISTIFTFLRTFHTYTLWDLER